MSKQREALDALEGIHPGNMTPMAEQAWNKAINAIREALADPVQEAAPDLLQALEGLLDCAIYGFDMPNDNQFVLNARAAIERAHGIGD